MILVGVSALALRSYLAPSEPPSTAVTPVSATVAQPVVAPVVAVPVTTLADEAVPKKAVSKKRRSQEKDKEPAPKRRRFLGIFPR